MSTADPHCYQAYQIYRSSLGNISFPVFQSQYWNRGLSQNFASSATKLVANPFPSAESQQDKLALFFQAQASAVLSGLANVLQGKTPAKRDSLIRNTNTLIQNVSLACDSPTRYGNPLAVLQQLGVASPTEYQQASVEKIHQRIAEAWPEFHRSTATKYTAEKFVRHFQKQLNAVAPPSVVLQPVRTNATAQASSSRLVRASDASPVSAAIPKGMPPLVTPGSAVQATPSLANATLPARTMPPLVSNPGQAMPPLAKSATAAPVPVRAMPPLAASKAVNAPAAEPAIDDWKAWKDRSPATEQAVDNTAEQTSVEGRWSDWWAKEKEKRRQRKERKAGRTPTPPLTEAAQPTSRLVRSTLIPMTIAPNLPGMRESSPEASLSEGESEGEEWGTDSPSSGDDDDDEGMGVDANARPSLISMDRFGASTHSLRRLTTDHPLAKQLLSKQQLQTKSAASTTTALSFLKSYLAQQGAKYTNQTLVYLAPVDSRLSASKDFLVKEGLVDQFVESHLYTDLQPERDLVKRQLEPVSSIGRSAYISAQRTIRTDVVDTAVAGDEMFHYDEVNKIFVRILPHNAILVPK